MMIDCIWCGGTFDDDETDICFWCGKKQVEESEFDFQDADED